MKKLLILLLVIPFLGFSQESESKLKKELKKTFKPQREGKLDVDRQAKLVDDFIERQVYKYRYSKQKKTK